LDTGSGAELGHTTCAPARLPESKALKNLMASDGLKIMAKLQLERLLCMVSRYTPFRVRYVCLNTIASPQIIVISKDQFQVASTFYFAASCACCSALQPKGSISPACQGPSGIP